MNKSTIRILPCTFQEMQSSCLLHLEREISKQQQDRHRQAWLSDTVWQQQKHVGQIQSGSIPTPRCVGDRVSMIAVPTGYKESQESSNKLGGNTPRAVFIKKEYP